MTRKITFAQDSHVEIDFLSRGDRTVMEDVYTTPPFRVMRPFYPSNGYCQVMVMNSSPGVLEGDRQIERYHCHSGTKVQITNQSYEKVFQMLRGDHATRDSHITVEDDGIFILRMLPMIMYKNADYRQNIRVDLTEGAKAIISSALVAGRTGSGERFEFSRYQSATDVYLDGELIYLENLLIEPETMDMLQIGLFEGYDHYMSISAFNFGDSQTHRESIKEIIEDHSTRRDLLGGISTTYRGDLQIRILGGMGQDLIECSQEIIEYLENK